MAHINVKLTATASEQTKAEQNYEVVSNTVDTMSYQADPTM